MKRLEDLINGTKLVMVLELILLGSMEEFHMATVVVLATLLIMTVSALIFLKRAKKEYAKRVLLLHMYRSVETRKDKRVA